MIDSAEWHVREFTFIRRDRDRAPWRCAKVNAGPRRVEVTRSPTGRSVRVFVDGNEIPAPDDR